jgi:2Fe-2S ferredoxin
LRDIFFGLGPASRAEPALTTNPSVPKITFLPGNQTIEYESSQLAYAGEGRRGSLLDVALSSAALNSGPNNTIDLRHACGGICACITCHVIVKQGAEHLSPMEHDEEDRIYRIPDYSLHSRLACRAVVLQKPGGEAANKRSPEITVVIPDIPGRGDPRG